MRNSIFTVVMGATILIGSMAHADDQAKCLVGRAAAQGKYQGCVQKWQANLYGSGETYERAAQGKLSKCREKYAATWTKLSALSGSTTCGGMARFIDNGTTVTDNLTGLVWEKKTTAVGSGTSSDRHDVDNFYTWSSSGTDGNGTAYTDFLSNLNNGGGFASTNDWRLPTFAELMTLVNQPYPCTTAPCIDSAFGATQSGGYWAATTFAPNNGAWVVDFSNGDVFPNYKLNPNYVRAVRGGL